MIEHKDYKIIVEMQTGSKVYGTSTPTSDDDLRGVCLPSSNILFSVFQNFEQLEEIKDKDRVLYVLKKFLKLSSDCNPNITEQFFTPESFYIKSTPTWEYIKKHKHLFISNKAKHTFSGYSFSQLLKLENHRKWILKAPTMPTREEFGLPATMLMGETQADALLHLPKEMFKEEYSDYAIKLKQYTSAVKEYNCYKDHIEQRNGVRRDLEKKFGYDTKHAYHLIRILEEGTELITTGNITLPRPNADYLMTIRQGEITLDDVLDKAHKLSDEMDKIYADKSKHVLPHHPDLKGIDKLYIEILKMENLIQ